MLNYLENEGLLGKIVLLNGYQNLAMDVGGLNLPQLKIEGVFMRNKLPTSIYASPAKAAQRLQSEDPSKYRLAQQSSPTNSSSPSKLSRKAVNSNNTQVCCIIRHGDITQVQNTTAREEKFAPVPA
jgi:hypothetical protein